MQDKSIASPGSEMPVTSAAVRKDANAYAAFVVTAVVATLANVHWVVSHRLARFFFTGRLPLVTGNPAASALTVGFDCLASASRIARRAVSLSPIFCVICQPFSGERQ